MNFLLDTRLNNSYQALSMNNILKPKSRNFQNNLMHIHEEGIKKKKKKKKKTYLVLPKEPKQTKTLILFNKKDNKCNELHCNGQIFNYSQSLCEYHYRIKRKNIISQTIGGCVYSKECRRIIFRRLLCAKHYKEKLNEEKKLLK